MEKIKALFFPLGFIILSVAAIKGQYLSLLMFPAAALLIYFLVKGDEFKAEIKTVITGAAVFIVFASWHLIRFDNFPVLFIIIYSLGLMAALEGWRYTFTMRNNLWGLMNLVVLWIALDYLLYLWLPFDITGWFLGTPLVLYEEASAQYLLYIGKQGFTFWVLVVGLLLFKAFEFVPKSINLLLLLSAVALMAIPILISPGIEKAEYFAQGEWIGRTCMWLSVLLLAYSFVKRKTKK